MSSSSRAVFRGGRLAGIAVSGVLACWASGRAFAQSITDLGVISGGTTSQGLGISGDGGTVVGQSNSAGVKAFRWTSAGGMQALALPPGSTSSVANASSAFGSVIAGNYSTTTTTLAFRWTSAGTQLISGPTGATFAEGIAISGDGVVIAGRFGVDSSIFRAFRWTSAGGAVDLGTIAGSGTGAMSQARGVSADGSVVVGRNIGSSGARGFRWTSGTGMLALPLAAGTIAGDAYCASSDGSVVGGSNTVAVGNVAHASRWTSAGGTEDLGVAPGATQSVVYAMNSSGSVLAGGPVAFFWTRAGGTVNLQSYLTSRGVNLTGWSLLAATGVSSDGRSMTGFGTFNGQSRAFLVAGLSVTCNADLNGSGAVNVQDIFDFLAAWFAGAPSSDFNGLNGINVQDIFDFLAAWFAGC